MFLDLRDSWPPEPWSPPPKPAPRLSRPQQRVMLWLVGLNVAFLLVAPICAATLIDAAVAMWRH